MERRRKAIGEILVELGRVSAEQVESALAHQRENGGYFGDALVDLGLVTRAELKWTLAGQLDLPFVQLRPENIDAATAALVPAAWARAHLVLPVLRAGDTVTVVLDNPLDVEKLDEVRRFTGAGEVEAALASAETILELIEAVHGAGSGPPVPLGRLLLEGIASGATEAGVSVRPGRVLGWYRGGGATTSRTLDDAWAADLEHVVSPFAPLSSSPMHGARSWPAILSLEGRAWRIECHAMGRGEAVEWSAKVEKEIPATIGSAHVDPDLLPALRRTAESGGAVVRVRACARGSAGADPTDLLETVLPTLPAAVGGPDVRSIHLSDRPAAVAPGLLYLLVRGPLDEALAGISRFAFEGVTLDLERLGPDDLEGARRAARLVAFHARDGADDLPVDFDLCLRDTGDGRLVWASNRVADGTD